MPVNRRYPLAELMDACLEYAELTNRRVTFEWALIAGKNDTPRVAEQLGLLLRPLKGRCHVNLIPLNPTEGYDGRPTDAVRVKEFITTLEKAGIPATARVRRGLDIDAGCGQLKTRVEKDERIAKGEGTLAASISRHDGEEGEDEEELGYL